LEALPILKNKVREMENMLSLETLKTSEPTTLRSYNRNSKDPDSFAKVMAMGQNVEDLMFPLLIIIESYK